jgi:N-acyl homoserine lactone hydrolase
MSRLSFCCLLILCLARAHAAAQAVPDDTIRLYVLDCGRAEFDDGAPVSDTGEFEGKPIKLADPCFLIRHPRGWLLWDAGLAPDAPGGPGFRVFVDTPIIPQLAKLGLTPDDITFLAFSHMHFDHVGNANLFSHATWIVNTDELAWGETEPAHVSMNARLFSAYHHAHSISIAGDHDVFGDGRVRIYHTPGHTPGSAVLWIDLRERGPVLLSGDLYLFRESRRFGYVPTVNADRADTLASIARVEQLVKRTHARVIIQHDPRDYAELPKLPDFWR